MVAILFAMLAAFGFGAGAVFARIGLQGMKPTTGTAISLVVSFILASILALSIDAGAFLTLPAIAFAWFLVLGILNYPVARLLNYSAVNMVGAAKSAPLISTAPLFSAILAIIFLGERPGVLVGIGTAAIILGSILVISERSRGSA